jgi:hypothetical protein
MQVDSDIVNNPFTVGALGALVTVAKFTPGIGWREKVLNVLAGSLSAGYLAPVVTEWLHMTSRGYNNGAAFMIGLLGMSVIAAVQQAIRELKLADIIAGWLSKKG